MGKGNVLTGLLTVLPELMSVINYKLDEFLFTVGKIKVITQDIRGS